MTFSPGGKRAWASGGGQNVVHVYSVGKGLREIGQIPTPYFPAGMAYGKTPRGDRIYVANNLVRRGGRDQPARAHGDGDRPEDEPRDGDDRPRPGAAALRRHVRPQRPQGLRDELDGALGVGHRHAHGARAAPDPALAAEQPAAGRPPERDRRQPAPQRGLHGQRQLGHGVGHRHAPRPRDPTMRVGLVRGARTGATPNGLAVSPDGQAALRRARRRERGRRARPRATASGSASSRRRGTRPTSTSRATARSSRSRPRTPRGRRPRRCAGPYAVGDCSTGDLAYSTAASRPSTKGGISVVRTPRSA